MGLFAFSYTVRGMAETAAHIPNLDRRERENGCEAAFCAMQHSNTETRNATESGITDESQRRLRKRPLLLDPVSPLYRGSELVREGIGRVAPVLPDSPRCVAVLHAPEARGARQQARGT